MKDIYDRIYDCVRLIPFGKVTTYGELAKMCGNKKMYKLVANAINHTPEQYTIPSHRVVNKNGELNKSFVFGGKNAQRNLLINEGVQVIDGKVDLKIYGFYFW